MKSVTPSASGDLSRDVRVGRIRNDIAKRLRSVCSNLTDDEFVTLIEQMTEVQLRSEGRAC